MMKNFLWCFIRALRVENIAEKNSYLWTARHIAYFWPLPAYPHDTKKKAFYCLRHMSIGRVKA